MSQARRLVVDGYNVIRSTPPYRELALRDLEAARAALVGDVAAYAGGDWDATVVFDGGGNPRSDGEPHSMWGVTVQFSPHGVDADAVIESLARRWRESGDSVEVVTSDAQTQWAVMGGSVVRRSATEFAGELRVAESEWREHTPNGMTKVRIEERIDPDIRATLDRWARGDG
ncbi:MAG: NYN domain-containing protein [Coriobacteriia bacterium]|nr:NYN domain-containing protein [Coriobacteriia bacterium]